MQNETMKNVNSTLVEINNDRIKGGMKPLFEKNASTKLHSMSKKELQGLVRKFYLTSELRGFTTMTHEQLATNLNMYLTVLKTKIVMKKKHKLLKGAGVMSWLKKKATQVKEYFRPRQESYNNQTSNTLKQYGDMPITKIDIVRNPINSVIDSILKTVSFGAFDPKKYGGYDKMFHLYMVCSVNGHNLVVEKNHVINVSKNYSLTADSEVMPVPLHSSFTLNQMLTKTRERVGDSSFFLYNPFSTNCQHFIQQCLISEQLYYPDVDTFVFQNIDELVKHLPQSTQTIAKFTTDLAGTADKILGNGKPKMKGGRIPLAEIQKAKQREAERQQQLMNDPKNDKYFERLDNEAELNSNNQSRMSNDWLMKKTPVQQERALRLQKERQSEFKASEDQRIADERAEAERIYQEELRKERSSGFFNKLTDFGVGALSLVPVVGDALSGVAGMATDALRGNGKAKKKTTKKKAVKSKAKKTKSKC